MKRFCVTVLLSVCLLFIVGCIAPRNTAFDPARSSIPKEAHKVGGGFEIAYTMPEDGTMVLADKTTGKTIQTISLREGETFEFTCKASDEKTFKDMGIDIQKADFVLYSYPKRARQVPVQSAMLMPPPPLNTPQR
jgi:hypothetical protein